MIEGRDGSPLVPPTFEDEHHFEREWVKVATFHGWATMHVKKASNRTPTSITGVEGTTGKGWLDRAPIWHEDHGILFVESKMDDGTVSPEQLAVMASLTAAGGRCCVWRPKSWHHIVGVLANGDPF